MWIRTRTNRVIRRHAAGIFRGVVAVLCVALFASGIVHAGEYTHAASGDCEASLGVAHEQCPGDADYGTGNCCSSLAACALWGLASEVAMSLSAMKSRVVAPLCDATHGVTSSPNIRPPKFLA